MAPLRLPINEGFELSYKAKYPSYPIFVPSATIPCILEENQGFIIVPFYSIPKKTKPVLKSTIQPSFVTIPCKVDKEQTIDSR